VFFVFVLITICEKLSVHFNFFWLLFGGMWEKNKMCVYLFMESKILLFQVIYQN
jgi:hypothetical protein